MTALPKTLELLFTNYKAYHILEWWEALTEQEKEEIYTLYALELRPSEEPLHWEEEEALLQKELWKEGMSSLYEYRLNHPPTYSKLSTL